MKKPFNEADLTKLIEEILFKQKPTNQPIIAYTGHGGAKQYVHTWMDLLKKEKTWRNFRRTYLFLIGTGGITKRGNSYRLN